MKLRMLLRAPALAAATASAGPCLADEAKSLQLADPAGYFESYLAPGMRAGDAKLVAPDRALVGLHLGYGKGPFNLIDLRVAVPQQMTSQLCVQISSPDGRYWSANGYRPAGNGGAPVRLQTRSKFEPELAARYLADEVPVAIRVADECEAGSKGLLIPAIPPGATDTDTLIAYINAPGTRVGARLLDQHENPIATGRCSIAADSPSIAFTETCAMPLTAEARQRASRLLVTIVGDAGTPVQTQYDLILPAPAP